MQNKASLILKRLTNYRRFSTTKGFVQLGHDVKAMVGSKYPEFDFCGRNYAGLLLVNFGF